VRGFATVGDCIDISGETPMTKSCAKSEETPPDARAHVLVVDEPNAARLATAVLTRIQADVESADSRFAAAERLASGRRFDVVVFGLADAALMKLVAERHAETAVIVVGETPAAHCDARLAPGYGGSDLMIAVGEAISLHRRHTYDANRAVRETGFTLLPPA